MPAVSILSGGRMRVCCLIPLHFSKSTNENETRFLMGQGLCVAALIAWTHWTEEVATWKVRGCGCCLALRAHAAPEPWVPHLRGSDLSPGDVGSPPGGPHWADPTQPSARLLAFARLLSLELPFRSW